MTNPVNNLSPRRPGQEKTEYLVSVIITTRNRSKYFREAIESVLAVQSQKFDLEVIVVDDGSSWDWLLRVARRHPIGRIEQPVLLFRQRGTADIMESGRNGHIVPSNDVAALDAAIRDILEDTPRRTLMGAQSMHTLFSHMLNR